MRDEMDARIWNKHGHQFSDDLHRLFTAAGAALARLGRAALEAPRSGVTPASRRTGQA
jgi:hypothetical protein